MFSKLTPAVALFSAALLSLSATANAQEPRSPIFGNAAATVTSLDKNKSIVGKGYYSDYYGYYGVLYSQNAQYYGTLGYYSAGSGAKSNYYSAAANYAYAAYSNFYNASVYARYGY